jgi:hypothetical protein
MKLKRFCWIFIVLAIIASPALGVTDTVYVQKRITDTLYVVSPPDTVYIQETVVKEASAEPEKNEFIVKYTTDTIPPTNKFYFGLGATALDVIAIWFGALLIDIDWEKENSYRGSLVFNFSSILLFGPYNYDSSWEGFRSIISPGVGYRHYLTTITGTSANPQKLPVKHKHTPLNSYSLYVQAMASPTFKMAYDGHKNEARKGRFDTGISVNGAFGAVSNSGNFLWNYEINFGYQYWDNKASRYLTTKTRPDEDVSYHIINGWDPKGFHIGTNVKLGF